MNRLFKILYLTLILFSFTGKIVAQQQVSYSDIYSNLYLLNPSTSGLYGGTNAFLHFKKEFWDIEGAPRAFAFTVDSDLKTRNVGLGFRVFSDEDNIIGSTGGMLSYRYKVKLYNQHKLYFGISGGFVQTKVLFDKIQAENLQEEALLSSGDAQTKFDSELGIFYEFDKLQFSFSTKHLFSPTYTYQDVNTFKTASYQLIPHYDTWLTYHFNLNQVFKLSPYVRLEASHGMQPLFSFAAQLMALNDYWLSVGLNNQLGANIMAGVSLYDNLKLAFGYNIPNKDLKALSKGSFEITVGYKFGGGKSTTSELKQYTTKQEINKLKDLTQQQFEIIDKLQYENEQLTNQLKENAEKVDSHQEEIERLKTQYEKDKKELEQVRFKYAVPIDQIEETDNNENIEDKYFIVVGAYLRIADAKAFQKILLLELKLETQLIEREDGKYIFVYSGKFSDKKAIKEEFKRLKKQGIDEYINGNIWIYQAK